MTVNQKKIGYSQVSTDDQNLDLQRDALTKAGSVEGAPGSNKGAVKHLFVGLP